MRGDRLNERVVEDTLVVEAFLRNPTEDTFFALYKALFERLRIYFILRGSDVPTAEELAQDVLFKVYRKVGELRDSESFGGWLYAIARNALVSHWRSQQSRLAGAELEPLTADLRDRLITEAEVMPKLRLQEWLAELDPGENELVILRYVEGLSYEELARALGVPLGTVKWRISEIRRKLSRIMGVKLRRD
jgi:RNA polymerase sigma-70 factor (ECF subfamily)